ncbi:MAG: mechanosensitive ion channel [Zoogloeaceae bacterium]|jgi:small-conductance mechanosensitive channel|nr:mechanosensitive ion channel [Zoogloeaceae bacterium]
MSTSSAPGSSEAMPLSDPTFFPSSRLSDLLKDFWTPGFYWQLLIVAVCLLAAWGLARILRSRFSVTRHDAGLPGVMAGQAFPLLAIFFMIVARAVMGAAPVLNISIPLLLSLALVRALRHMLYRSFPHAHWLTKAGRVFSILVWGWLALFLSGIAPEVIVALKAIGLQIGGERIDLWMLINGVVVVALTLLFSLWLSSFLEARLLRSHDLDVSLRIVLVRVSKAFFILLAVLLSFSLIGLDITALSVFTGALGVGLGMGLQRIASNYVSGFIILLDHSIRLGSLIQVNNETSGAVTQITTRYTVLKNLVGDEFIVPNETLVNNIVRNQTFSDSLARVVTAVSVAYSSDLEKVLPLLEGIAKEQPRVLESPAPSASIARFSDSSIDLELSFWVNDPEKGTGGLRSQVNLAIWRHFRDEGIEMPFPQREVRILNQKRQEGRRSGR